VKSLLLFIVTLFISANLWADSVYFPSDKSRDSLINLLQTSEKEQLVDVLNKLSLYYNISDPSKASAYIQQAKNLAGELDYKAGLAFATKEEGMMKLNNGEIIPALTLLEQARNISVEINDYRLIGESLHCIGLVYSAFGFHEYALKYLNEAMDVYRQGNENQLVAYCYYDQAAVYVKNEEFQKALDRVRECDQFSLSNEVRIEGGLSHILLADIYAGMHKDTLALENYKLGLVLIGKENLSPRINAAGLRALGKFYLEKGLYKEAKKSFFEAKTVIDEGTNDIEKGEIMLDLSSVCLKQNYLRSALEMIDSALIKSEKTKAIALLTRVLFTKAEILKKMGLEGPALRDISRAYTLQDSINSEGYKNYIADMVASFEIQKSNLKIKALNNQLEATQGELASTNTLSKYYLAATLFFVALLAFIALNQQKLKKVTKKLYAVNEQVNNQNIELKRLDDEKSDLIKLVAHDMRSPVNNIVSIAGLLEHEATTAEERKEYVQLIASVCQRINSSISKFLGRNEHASLTSRVPELEMVSIDDLILETMSEFSPKAASKDIELLFTPTRKKPMVLTDGDYISQILSNLLSNAIKYCQSGATVSLEFAMQLKHCAIIVRDNGPGISKKEQLTLFDKYTTTSNKATGNESSTGLGLSIAKKLTQALGGDIQVESDIGRGCQFIVSIPTVENSHVPQPTMLAK
jgi:signal transduction histidine kinase